MHCTDKGTNCVCKCGEFKDLCGRINKWTLVVTCARAVDGVGVKTERERIQFTSMCPAVLNVASSIDFLKEN